MITYLSYRIGPTIWRAPLYIPFFVLCLFILPAQAQLSSIQTTVNNINSTVNSINGRLTTIGTNVNTIGTNVTTIKTNAQDSVDAIRAGLNALSQDMREEITAGLNEVTEKIQEIRADRQAFLQNAPQFKQDLKNLLLNLENLGNEIAQFTALPVSLEFERERNLIDALPDSALAPLHRALVVSNGNNFLGELANRLGQAVSQLQILTAASIEVSNVSPNGIPTTCEVILSDPQRLRNSAFAIARLGNAVNLIGKGLVARGATGIPGKPVQIHGYAGLVIEDNPKRKWGKRVVAIADVLSKISSYATNKLNYCTQVEKTNQILTILDTLNLDLSNLDVAVSSRASQPSVDAIQVALNQNLDVAVSSRATQSSVDTLQIAADNTQATVSMVKNDLGVIQDTLDTIQGSKKIDLEVIEVSQQKSRFSRRWLVLATHQGQPVEVELTELWAFKTSRRGPATTENLLLGATVFSTVSGLLDVTVPVTRRDTQAHAYQFAVQNVKDDSKGSTLVGAEGTNRGKENDDD